MLDRFASGYNDFVLPFLIGMLFIIIYLIVGAVRIIYHLPSNDRKKFFLSLINPKILLKDFWNIICDVLIHVKIFKRNKLLGYMHSSIAFGWFMLIVLGHIETWMYVPHRAGLLYYPVFFRFFVMETNYTIQGAFFFFLMDFFLLIVLSGIFLAMFKRIRSQVLGMRRTTKPSLPDRIAMYSLWAIFPLRLLAESFTAGISGGSFLTKPMYLLFSNFLSDTYHILPTWWAYSSALGLFFICMPFSRYMHIPTEAFLIMLRNAGIKVKQPRKGYAEAEIYSCSSCGLCLDACPMGTQKKNLKYSSVYYIRFLRRRNTKKCIEIADKCLMCGKCEEICPVGVKSCGLKLAQRNNKPVSIHNDFSYINESHINSNNKVLYYGGCMTQLTPVISRSLINILSIAGIDYTFMDKDGGICCGRPLLLAGKDKEAKELINKNKAIIESSEAKILLVSCPICYKIFKDEYNLNGIQLLHHTQYINQLINDGKITLRKGSKKYVFHDPCELGRGSNIYNEPRNIIASIGNLVSAQKEGKESICCGGSIGSTTLSFEDRKHITDSAITNLMINNPDTIVTACPLCLKTFTPRASVNVKDISEIVLNNIDNYNNERI